MDEQKQGNYSLSNTISQQLQDYVCCNETTFASIGRVTQINIASEEILMQLEKEELFQSNWSSTVNYFTLSPRQIILLQLGISRVTNLLDLPLSLVLA